MRIKTSMNAREFEKNYERNSKPSLTIPDQTMSIRTILERHSRGLPIDGMKVPIWEGEENDLPDWRTLDLSERQELAEHYKQEIESIKNRQNNPQNVDKDNERVDAIESISGEPSTDL
jgi:hypothetical protein